MATPTASLTSNEIIEAREPLITFKHNHLRQYYLNPKFLFFEKKSLSAQIFLYFGGIKTRTCHLSSSHSNAGSDSFSVS